MTENTPTTRRGRKPKPAMINTALIEIMRKLGPIPKLGKNEKLDFFFRRIEDIYNRIAPLFAEHGILTRITLLSKSVKPIETKNRQAMMHAVVVVRYDFIASDGSEFSSTVPGEAMNVSDKALGAAMSYAHKTTITQMFNIPTKDMDPDWNTPQWAAEEGTITLAAFNNLKTQWRQWKQIPENSDKVEMSRAFAAWVEDVTGSDFSSGDFRQWKLSDFVECQEAMNGEVPVGDDT